MCVSHICEAKLCESAECVCMDLGGLSCGLNHHKPEVFCGNTTRSDEIFCCKRKLTKSVMRWCVLWEKIWFCFAAVFGNIVGQKRGRNYFPALHLRLYIALVHQSLSHQGGDVIWVMTADNWTTYETVCCFTLQHFRNWEKQICSFVQII